MWTTFWPCNWQLACSHCHLCVLSAATVAPCGKPHVSTWRYTCCANYFHVDSVFYIECLWLSESDRLLMWRVCNARLKDILIGVHACQAMSAIMQTLWHMVRGALRSYLVICIAGALLIGRAALTCIS